MKTYTRQYETPPAKMVNNGKFTFGTFNGPFKTINMLDAKKPLPLSVPKLLKYMRLKEWEAFQIGNGDYFILGAIYNAKLMGVVQLVVIDIKKNKKYIFEKLLPPWKPIVGTSLLNQVSYSAGRKFSFHLHNHLEQDRIRVTIRTQGQKGQPDLNCWFEASHKKEDTTPIVICQPFGPNRALYSHKALMPLTGELEIGGEKIPFTKERGFMILDDHKGYYPFEMKYDWITTAGHDQDGRLTGFNLTDNQVQDHETYNENCLWIGNTTHLLPPIKFSRPDGAMGKWYIKDSYGRVDIEFTPEIEGKVDINALLFKTKYRAPYGRFSGFITDDDGNRVSFDQFYGMGEDKYIRS
ncbi:MAG: DUF2804 domain-containing protein [Desulfobacterium sp.]|nr:DUF2804 domain-containing protein [Desulfobacterium sp.]